MGKEIIAIIANCQQVPLASSSGGPSPPTRPNQVKEGIGNGISAAFSYAGGSARLQQKRPPCLEVVAFF
jgi:hypothetical protein